MINNKSIYIFHRQIEIVRNYSFKYLFALYEENAFRRDQWNAISFVIGARTRASQPETKWHGIRNANCFSFRLDRACNVQGARFIDDPECNCASITSTTFLIHTFHVSHSTPAIHRRFSKNSSRLSLTSNLHVKRNLLKKKNKQILHHDSDMYVKLRTIRSIEYNNQFSIRSNIIEKSRDIINYFSVRAQRQYEPLRRRCSV